MVLMIALLYELKFIIKENGTKLDYNTFLHPE